MKTLFCLVFLPFFIHTKGKYFILFLLLKYVLIENQYNTLETGRNHLPQYAHNIKFDTGNTWYRFTYNISFAKNTTCAICIIYILALLVKLRADLKQRYIHLRKSS